MYHLPFIFRKGAVIIVIGLGTDIVEVSRIKKAIENQKFLERVYTEKEQKYCGGRGNSGAASFAGRFAAKEAVLKAFGTGLRDGKLTDIEIVNDELGCPKLNLYGFFREKANEMGVTNSLVSISHCKEYATAQCIMER